MRRLLFECSDDALFVAWHERAVLTADEREVLSEVHHALKRQGKHELMEMLEMVSSDTHTTFHVIYEADEAAFGLEEVINAIRGMDPKRVRETELLLEEVIVGCLPREKATRSQVLVDVPMESATRKLGGDISVVYDDRGSRPNPSLATASPIVGGVRESFSRKLARLRIYAHPNIWRKAHKVPGALAQIEQHLRLRLSSLRGASQRG